MAELGYMEDPGHRMGWLDGQSLRAARVVIDIGVHCGFEAPDEVGGGEWTYDKAWKFLTNHANQGEAWLRFELNRYLGWPGQAPSYKIGERLWLQLREEVREREGERVRPQDVPPQGPRPRRRPARTPCVRRCSGSSRVGTAAYPEQRRVAYRIVTQGA